MIPDNVREAMVTVMKVHDGDISLHAFRDAAQILCSYIESTALANPTTALRRPVGTGAAVIGAGLTVADVLYMLRSEREVVIDRVAIAALIDGLVIELAEANTRPASYVVEPTQQLYSAPLPPETKEIMYLKQALEEANFRCKVLQYKIDLDAVPVVVPALLSTKQTGSV